MRIEINTQNKTIVILSPVNLKELMEELPKMVKDINLYSITSKVEQQLPYYYQYPITTNPVTQPLSPPFYTTCEFGVQKGLPEWNSRTTLISN